MTPGLRSDSGPRTARDPVTRTGVAGGGSGPAGAAGTGDRPASAPLGGAADPELSTGALRGPDLARAALEAARAAAKARGRGPGRPRRGGGAGQSRRRRSWSGARPDDRDPQPLGRLASRLAADRGWTDRLAGGQVFGRWATLVGADVAEHARPVTLRDGELTVQASSTAWATQLRLLQRQLLAKIAAGVGPDVVKRLRVQGPAAPSWRKGPLHVPGRGPRDTYG
ncbi:Predicted nucleic acid-binding protein, contains Zn-ribbon domain (includes truncated derivatives) [Streptoalloteichus hindustanus]|uniref:UPF0232 protein SAMN05444320_101634 n=1 Tax=Streptoalloteichus hindustanus TaxID=2017 RepID=A0A1M4V4J0_STRHI|nr:Predicted nucleic acid-binding protein, contains Zn-ribbon domain (includes truncated derivatives) [Streptoalloteichus hindustanus]